MGIGKRVNSEVAENNAGSTAHAHSTTLSAPKFCLSDLIIPASTSASLDDFLAYKKHENLIFNQWGLAITHQHHRQNVINLYGAPGTGKTMAAHAIADALKQPLLAVDYASLESKYVGETSKNITEIFKQAREENAIIFCDEADAILSRRVTNMSHATDVSVNQTRSVLLTLMNEHTGLIIFTTNFIENYDPAFMRRILAHIHFELPDLQCRHKLWQQYIPQSLPCHVDINTLSALSEGLSGSDISSSVLKAAMSAARQSSPLVSIEHFEKAIIEIKHSKAANTKSSVKIESRPVDETYVVSQIGEVAMQELKG